MADTKERWLDTVHMRTPAVDRLTTDLKLLTAQYQELQAQNTVLQRSNRELELAIRLLLEVLVPLDRLHRL